MRAPKVTQPCHVANVPEGTKPKRIFGMSKLTAATPEQAKEANEKFEEQRKKQMKEDKKTYNLHVEVIQFQDKLPLPDARVKAWLEGKPGLGTRLAKAASQAE